MNNSKKSLVNVGNSPKLLSQTPNTEDLVNAFLSGKSPRTLNAYRKDLENFGDWLGVESIDDCARVLLSQALGAANHTVLTYRNSLIEQGLSPATVNRRLAALRSLVKLAKTLGLIAWTLEVPGVKSKAYRDTRGCGIQGVRMLLDVVRTQRNPVKCARDTLLIRLAFDLGLRRGEIVFIDLSDLDLSNGRIHICGKGRTEKEALTLPIETQGALLEWVEIRPATEDQALFINLDNQGARSRLSPTSVYRLIRSLGDKAGIKARPHGIRHSAITAALDLTGGDVRRAQRFSRHSNPATTIRYDVNKKTGRTITPGP